MSFEDYFSTEKQSKYRWFRGNGSFPTNHYAIFYDGLGPHNPNFIALNRGFEVTSKYLRNVSLGGKSSFGRFISYLEKIQQKEANKENKYLTLKIDKMRTDGLLSQEYYNKIQYAWENGNFNEAFTLLFNYEKNLKELNEEINSNHFKSFQKTNKFWATNFSKFLAKKLEEVLINTGEQLLVKDDAFLSIDDIVESFFNEMGVNSNSIASGVEEMRETYVNQLKALFESKGIISNKDTWLSSSNLFPAGKDYKNLAKKSLKTSGGKNGKGKRKIRSVHTVIDNLGGPVARGMSMELQAALDAQRAGGKAILTGKLQKELYDYFGEKYSVVAQKGDVISFEIFNASMDTDAILEEILKSNEPNLELIRKKIKQSVPIGDIFEIEQNVKGYTSNYNLSIEQEGTFAHRLGRLKELAGNTNDFNNLIFLLVNTTEGCIADKKLSELSNYLAAAFAVWMWDDYADIYSKSISNGIQKIHLFNSGGAYFSASGIMEQAIEALKSNFGENGHSLGRSNPLFDITISPGYFTDEEYSSLISQKEYSLNDNMSEEQVQDQLKKRWDFVRNTVLNRGKLTVHMDQSYLDRLVGDLEYILREI